MNNYFIKKIEIKENKFIKKIDIPLSSKKRIHLIFTGKNGSGKTTILKEIDNLMSESIKLKNNNSLKLIFKNNNAFKPMPDRKMQYSSIYNRSKVRLIFSNDLNIDDIVKFYMVEKKFILAYFKAKRENTPTVSSSIKNINLETQSTTDTSELHKKFIEYMVKKRTDMLNDKFDGDGKKADKIQKWFDNFENTLKTLFNEPSLILKYYSEELNFKIEYNNRSFGLNELSDGYSSLLAILTELVLRMEAHNVNMYDMQGVVLIDEIETHLHVDLQKKILPFLVDFFPRIQFIVSTHSPFVLSSLSNAVICDLEKNFVTQDLSAYSYDALIESYFDNDKYSQEIKDKLKEFEILSKKATLSEIEQEEYREYKQYFKNIPKFMADELAVKINEILLNDLGKR